MNCHYTIKSRRVKLQNKITSEVAKEFLDFAKEVTEWCTLKIKLIEL